MMSSRLESNTSLTRMIRRFLPSFLLSLFLFGFALPVFSQTKEVEKLSGNNPAFPYWNQAKLSEVAYGIEMNTLDASDNAPWIILHGTKGSSVNKIKLDNEPADNFVTNRKDYFLISGEDLGRNIGIPVAIEFMPNGNDGWSFDQVKIDYFVGRGANFRYKGDWQQKVNANKRPVGGWASSSLVDRIEIEGVGKIDGNGIGDGRGYNQVNQILYSAPSETLSNGSGRTVTVPVSSKIIIVDARHSPSDIPWNSSSTSNVSSSDVIKALQRKENSSGTSNTLTIGMESSAEAEGNALGQKVKASMKYSFSNALTVNKSRMDAVQNEKTRNLQEQYGQSDGQTFVIPKGYVAFFERTVSVSVEQKTVNKVKVINKHVSPSYSLVATYFTTDPSTGELVLYNYTPSTQTVSYGGALKNDPSLKRFKNAAFKAWPYFKTTL